MVEIVFAKSHVNIGYFLCVFAIAFELRQGVCVARNGVWRIAFGVDKVVEKRVNQLWKRVAHVGVLRVVNTEIGSRLLWEYLHRLE